MNFKIFNILFILFFFFSSNVSSKIEEKIIAKIGNEIITKYDIFNEINTILALSNITSSQGDLANLQGIAFKSLKKKLIKKNEIQRYKVNRYSEVDLDNYILGIEKNIGLKDIKLEDHFKKFGADYKIFIDATVINLKWNTLIYSLYRKQLDVDEELLKTEINTQIKKERKITEYNLSEIVIDNSDNKKLNEVKKNIEKIGFEKTATLYSDSVTSSNGGAIGWIDSKSISSSYLNEISNLKINQISRPIVTNNNIIIIKLNDKRITNQNDVDLKKIEKNILNKKKEEKLNVFSNSHFLDLEKKTYVEINE